MFLIKKKQLSLLIYSPVSGKFININKVEDPLFSQEILGTGFAIIPKYKKEQKIEFVSPFDGILKTVFNTGHAYGIKDINTGIECLIHIGIDTIELDNKIFDIKVKQNQLIKKSETMVIVDLQKIINERKKTTTPIIFLNETMKNFYLKKIINENEEVTINQLIAKIEKNK